MKLQRKPEKLQKSWKSQSLERVCLGRKLEMGLLKLSSPARSQQVSHPQQPTLGIRPGQMGEASSCCWVAGLGTLIRTNEILL